MTYRIPKGVEFAFYENTSRWGLLKRYETAEADIVFEHEPEQDTGWGGGKEHNALGVWWVGNCPTRVFREGICYWVVRESDVQAEEDNHAE